MKGFFVLVLLDIFRKYHNHLHINLYLYLFRIIMNQVYLFYYSSFRCGKVCSFYI